MSNRKCCVPGCLNSLDTFANLHKFPNPLKDKELFNTWVYSIGGEILQLENEHIFKYRRVCRVHFEQKYCCRNNRLTYEAVPTRNMPEPTTSPRCATVSRDILPKHLHATIAVENAQIKTNLEPSTSPKCATVSRDILPTHLHATIAVENAQIKTNLEDRKKQQRTIATKSRVKRAALTQSELALYRKLMQVRVKLSKCRNKVKKQANKIKELQNLMRNPEFSKTLSNLPTTSKILTFREHKEGNKGHRVTLKEKNCFVLPQTEPIRVKIS